MSSPLLTPDALLTPASILETAKPPPAPHPHAPNSSPKPAAKVAGETENEKPPPPSHKPHVPSMAAGGASADGVAAGGVETVSGETVSGAPAAAPCTPTPSFLHSSSLHPSSPFQPIHKFQFQHMPLCKSTPTGPCRENKECKLDHGVGVCCCSLGSDVSGGAGVDVAFIAEVFNKSGGP